MPVAAQPKHSSSSSCLLLERPRQKNPEGGAAARSGTNLDLSVVELDDAIDHGQPDTGPIMLRREVKVKDLLEIFRRYSNTRIFEADLHLLARGGAAHEPQRAAVGHRLAGIDRQIEKGLTQHPGVAVDVR